MAITQSLKLTPIFIFFIIISSLFTQVISSNVIAEEINATIAAEEPKIGIIGTLIKGLGKFMTLLVPIFRFAVVAVAADPPFIEIGYNETVNVEVGMWNTGNGTGFEIWSIEHPVFTDRFLNFQVLQYPYSNDEGWFVTFDPYLISVTVGTELKTNMSITLTRPPNLNNPIQSGILKVRVFDTWAYGNLYLPPKGSSRDNFPNRALWFISAVFLMKFAKYSGTVNVEYNDVNILVKIKPYHAVRFDTSPTINLQPDQITSIPISMQNMGNYNDTYGFRIKSKNNDIQFATPYYITLAPGETSRTYIGISTPLSAFDYGTFHEIIIETYSIDDPNVTIAEKQVFIETKGVYISELSGIGIFFLIILIVLAVAFYIHRRKKFIEKYCIKPDKPWETPEEKKYLDTLMKTDKERHKEVLNMMEKEYESALLWYKYYCKKIVEPKPIKIEKIKKEKIKPDSIKEKKKPVIEEESKKEIVKKPLIEKQDVKKIDTKLKDEESKKQQVLSRIKKEQDKQKNKFKT